MPNLGAKSTYPFDQLTVRDDSASDPRPQHDVDQVAAPFGSTEQCLTQRRTISIVPEHAPPPKSDFQQPTQRHVLPTHQVRRE